MITRIQDRKGDEVWVPAVITVQPVAGMVGVDACWLGQEVDSVFWLGSREDAFRLAWALIKTALTFKRFR